MLYILLDKYGREAFRTADEFVRDLFIEEAERLFLDAVYYGVWED